ncbi:hydantoinase/oxoprolinase family protein [Bacillus aerolatus]|uniref:Hydantoinase/oxoprolinase family protein n=1 Tax=Bacillus aerolatus TaxID=2653354 RepID=A0A6I1FU92_9BACI|nr:hydantoinase/oxoprolinase family protein [Bacillus aerolatus]KAB7708265.1 hydantoinase/oxoprolinase family protein [Bacillus aerolatus]
MGKYHVAVDVGGTFTDVYAFNDSSKETIVAKTPSVPSNPEIGILNGIKKANISGDEIKFFSHGTTVGTNALIERKLPKTILVTTKGFRDVAEIRRGNKADLWDAYNDVAPPYISRRNRMEINERTDYAGNILIDVDENEVRELARIIRKKEAESIAICLINSYVNGENERIVKEILQEELPNVYICISSEILPEIFEHERMSTTIINAVLGPKVNTYMKNLQGGMKEKGYNGNILVLHSGGGVMTSETVPRFAARIASSGIAAGAIASKYIANLCGFQNAIGLDMGGTSADISLMYEGNLTITKDWYIEYGYPIGFPSIQIQTIGAGGGSIAWIDEGGSLRNGPHSAGAVPGPACYSQGGDQPTNTDANLILGRLGSRVLDGNMELNVEESKKAIKNLCEAFDYSEYEAACAILKVANANMCDALRLISINQGYDPREFALVAFGGAGPLHGAYLAKEMGIPNIIIPAHPGVTAALGCTLVDVTHDISKTYVANVKDVRIEEIEKEFSLMEEEAIKLLKEDNVEKENMHLVRYIEMRYVGQWRSLSTTVTRPLTSLEDTINIFHKEHERVYAYSSNDQEIEIYGLRVQAIGHVPKPEFVEEKPNGDLKDALKEKRDVYFEEAEGFVQTPIYSRPNIPVQSIIKGPAVVEQIDSTIVIPPNFEARIDNYRNIILSWKGGNN